MRDSFIMYTEYCDMLDAVTAEQAGRLIRAMVKYSRDEDPELSDPVVAAVFATIKPRMDRDREKWEQEVRRRAEAGRKGGLQRARNAKQWLASASSVKGRQGELGSAKEHLAIQADTDTDSDSEIKEKTNKREKQTDLFDRLANGRSMPDDVRSALYDWIQYKAEKREPYKQIGMQSLITQAINKSAEVGSGRVVDVIRQSIASGYKGITWDRARRPASGFNNGQERVYNMSDLELKLRASN